MNARSLVSALSFAVVLLACGRPATTADAAREQAAADFDCAPDNVSVTHEGAPPTYVASGCGRTARYVCAERGRKVRPRSGEIEYHMECMAQDR